MFTSKAKYYEPAGAVSWDVSMTATPDDWAVAVKAGDKLSISTTYDTSRASWYESMGLAWCGCTTGRAAPTRSPAPSTRRACSRTGTCPRTTTTAGPPRSSPIRGKAAAGPLTTGIPIGSFEYGAGDLTAKG